MTASLRLKKHWVKIVLFLILIVGLVLRFIHFENTTFGYDQARDALVARRMFIDDPIKIQGPTTDIPGLFHGALYWYLIAPFYFFAKGDPLGPKVFLTVLNLLNVFFIFFFSKKLFGKTSVALISAFIFAVSLEAIQYGRWLSNPSPALLSIAVFYYGVWLALNKKPLGIGLMLLGLSVSMQLQAFLAYLSLFFIFTTIHYLKSSSIKTLFTRANVVLTGLALFFFTPYLISELKFKFQASKAFLGFLTKSEGEVKDPFFILQKLNRFIDSLVTNVSYNIVDFSRLVSTITLVLIVLFAIWIIIKSKKERGRVVFLILWLLSPGLIYVLEKNNSYFLNIGNIYPLIILTALMIEGLTSKLSKTLRILAVAFFLGVIAISNISFAIQNNKTGESLFSVQNSINLADEKKMIDWMYGEAGGKPFSVNSVTNPLFTNTNWSYLFEWYGRGKYGYMPIWAGYPQDGVFGAEIQFAKKPLQPGLVHFLIIEPSTGIPHEYILAYRVYEHNRGRLVESRQFGEFSIEKRILEKNTHFLRDDLVKYLPNQDTLLKPLDQ